MKGNVSVEFSTANELISFFDQLRNFVIHNQENYPIAEMVLKLNWTQATLNKSFHQLLIEQMAKIQADCPDLTLTNFFPFCLTEKNMPLSPIVILVCITKQAGALGRIIIQKPLYRLSST